jgi:cation transport ATPase
LSIAVNAASVILSAAGILDPVSGALVHSASSLLVVMNSASLLTRKFNGK